MATVDMEIAINHMNDNKRAGIPYSMGGARIGISVPELNLFADKRKSGDCSGTVYAAVRKAGAAAYNHVVSTESMHDWLKKNGFVLIAENVDWSMQRGDIVIWGKFGQSGGSGGHTGICTDDQNWIECTAWKNGVIIANHYNRWVMAGKPYFYVYRLKAASKPASKPESNNQEKPSDITQIKEEDFMFIYWKRQTLTSPNFDAYFVFGNKRMYIPNDKLLQECRTLIKTYKGDTNEHFHGNDNFGLLTLEATTELVKFEYRADKDK